MKTCVVNVATGVYRKGQDRLKAEIDRQGECGSWRSNSAANWPKHSDVPYAFKACALMEAAGRGFDMLLWCDASVVPIRPIAPLWEIIERDGYWLSKNNVGTSNYEWTADSAYPDLFPELFKVPTPDHEDYLASPPDMAFRKDIEMEIAHELNATIIHVAATAFGISLKHDIGKRFLAEYHRLATTTKSFCGPWINSNHPNWLAQPGARLLPEAGDGRVAQCGPPDVRGHRHDQSCASVIAWRLGMKLTEQPDIFAYGWFGDQHDARTILLADGAY